MSGFFTSTCKMHWSKISPAASQFVSYDVSGNDLSGRRVSILKVLQPSSFAFRAISKQVFLMLSMFLTFLSPKENTVSVENLKIQLNAIYFEDKIYCSLEFPSSNGLDWTT